MAARVNEFGFRRLPGSSKRFENVAAGATISERQMATLRREAKLGERVSKERYKKQIDKGERAYDAATALRQAHVKHARLVNNFAPEMTAADRRVAYKWLDLQRDGRKGPAGKTASAMTADEQRRFNRLYARYNGDDIRQIFGSKPKDYGSFGIAA